MGEIGKDPHLIYAPPIRVVAVAPGGIRGGFAYVIAAVYELSLTKSGRPVYKRSPNRFGQFPHRSKRLALQDAERLATELKVPLWPDTRHWDTVQQAFEKSPEEKLRRQGIN